eukprot:3068900-Pyramimonas_sp.AAC.1
MVQKADKGANPLPLGSANFPSSHTLVIPGHTMSVITMKSYSCSSTCPGVFSRPTKSNASTLPRAVARPARLTHGACVRWGYVKRVGRNEDKCHDKRTRTHDAVRSIGLTVDAIAATE